MPPRLLLDLPAFFFLVHEKVRCSLSSARTLLNELTREVRAPDWPAGSELLRIPTALVGAVRVPVARHALLRSYLIEQLPRVQPLVHAAQGRL